MVVYYCNKCKQKIDKSVVTTMQYAKSDGVKKSLHLCPKCFDAVMTYINTSESKSVAPTTFDTEAAEMHELNADIEHRVVAPENSFHSVDEVQDRLGKLTIDQCFMAADSLPDSSVPFMYGDSTTGLSGRAAAYRSVQVLLSYYRGYSLEKIRRTFNLTMQQTRATIRPRASIEVYERWFDLSKEFDGFANLEKVSEVIAAICAPINFRDIVSDAGLDPDNNNDVNKVIAVAEYYSGICLTDDQRFKFIMEGRGL